MLASVVLMTLLSTAPPTEAPLARCEELSTFEKLEEESLLTHPFWRGWFSGAGLQDPTVSSDMEGLRQSFVAVHELPAASPRFRAPLALPPPLTGELTVTLTPSVRKREGLACISVSLTTDPDRPKVRSMVMEEPPLQIRAQVKNAGLRVLDVTWEARELTYSEDEPQGRKVLTIPHPPVAGSGYQDNIRVLLGDARDATALFESPTDDSLQVHGDLLESLIKLGVTWEKVLRSPPPEQVSRAWRQLLLELIRVDLGGPLDPRDSRRAEKARKLEALARLPVDVSAEPLWGPLVRAWLARLRPPPAPRAPMGRAELSIMPAAGKSRTGGSIVEVWLDDRRILCPGCAEPAWKGVTTVAVDVPSERAVRLWMRWKDHDGVHESEEWVSLLPDTRYRLSYAWSFRSASEQGGRVSIVPESGARGEQPACVTIDTAGKAAPGLGWADVHGVSSLDAPLPRVQPVAFGTFQPASPEQTLAVLPARGDTTLTYKLWTMLPVRYLHSGNYRFMLEPDGAVRLRFTPEVGDCKPMSR